jgi:hypothetical protein
MGVDNGNPCKCHHTSLLRTMIRTAKNFSRSINRCIPCVSWLVAFPFRHYLVHDLSPLQELQWTRPFDKVFLDNITKLQNRLAHESI